MTSRKNGNGNGTTETKRCAIYTRKSTTAGLEQEFNSLDAQRAACLTYVQRQPGWRVIDEHFDDGGKTGAHLDRPAFARLMQCVEAGKVDVVLVYKVDRLSRSLLDFAGVMDRFNKAGAAFVSVTQAFSTADAIGKLTLNMLMSFAEFEREMISERTRDKIGASRKRGKWTGGVVPLGYDVVEKKLVVNDFEAVTIRQLFDLYDEHGSAMVVADLLNERGRTNKGRKGKDGATLPGAPWDKDAVTRVVRNPLYAGLTNSDGETFTGEHQGIIDPDRWHRIVAVLDDHVIAKQRRPRNQAYLLRGLLWCAHCGHALTPASTRKDGCEYRYYRCTTRDQHGKRACPGRPLPAEAIEGFVAARIREVTQDGDLASDLTARLEQRLEQQRKGLLVERASLPLQLAAVDAEARKFLDQRGDAEGAARRLIDERIEVIGQQRGVLESRLAEVDGALAALEGAQVEAGWVADCLAHFDAVFDEMSVANQGRLVRAIVDRVEVNAVTGVVNAVLVDLAGAHDGNNAVTEPVSRPECATAMEATS